MKFQIIINDITNRRKKNNRFQHKLDINKNTFVQPNDKSIKLIVILLIQESVPQKKRNTLNLSCNLKFMNNSFDWLDVTEVEVNNI